MKKTANGRIYKKIWYGKIHERSAVDRFLEKGLDGPIHEVGIDEFMRLG